MKIVEIFKSIEGEGKRAGKPATFIRMYSCNLWCSYCDSRYACENEDYTEMSVDEILDKVHELGLYDVTLTGGEPLIQEGIAALIQALQLKGYYINVETNGSQKIDRSIESPRGPKVFYTVDYKCPSSGMESKMCMENFTNWNVLTHKDVVKFVVGDKNDLDVAKELIQKNHLDAKCSVYLSPVFGKIEPAEIVQYVLDNNMRNVKVQLQLHKFIWDPNKRGV